MKDADPKELKPIYIQTVDNIAHDEISLVDIAKMLVRRKKLIIGTIILIIVLTSSVIAFKPKTYTFSSSIEVASHILNGTIQPIEQPQALLAKINTIFIPLTLKTHLLTDPNDTTVYKIKTYIPGNTLIVVTEIQGHEDKTDTIKNLLQVINQKAIQSQNSIYNSIKQYTESRLDQAKAELNMLKNSNDNETEMAVQLSLIDTYLSQLATLRNTREILPAMQSIEPTGASRTLKFTIAIITSVFLGVFSAFFAEFVTKVKQTK